MKDNKNLDESLKQLNKDIHWNEDRQQHIRTKLIHQMRQHKHTRTSPWRRKLLPAFSIVLTLLIVTIIALNEFGLTQMMSLEENGKRTASDQAYGQKQIALTDDKKPEKEYSNDNEETDGDEHVPSHEDDNETDEPLEESDLDEHHSDERLLTQQEIMTAIKGQITSDLPVKLPKEITLREGKHVTAVTSSSPHMYEVIFYQHDEPIPINNKQLFSDDNPAEIVARVHVKKYDTQDQADDAVAYEIFDEHTGNTLNLNEELTGYQSSQDGIRRTSWNVGRWALTVRAPSDDPSLAQDVVDYLDVYMLPAPQQHGYAHLDAAHGDNQVTWQEETTVYTIDQVANPLKALEMTVNFE